MSPMPIPLGFMQGRLSPLYDGRIQSFPWDHWQHEFQLAAKLGFSCIEWTLDRERLDENPIMTEAGRRDIARLCREFGIRVETLTGDCFMQAPFHREGAAASAALLTDARRILHACRAVGVESVVIPIVDNGAVSNDRELETFVAGIHGLLDDSGSREVRLLIESENEPGWISALLALLPAGRVGINYDAGNSAACGYVPTDEFTAYGPSIGNLHIKDRLHHGATVPLGEGAANFDLIFGELRRVGYQGRYILQTARAPDNDHIGALQRYRDFVLARVDPELVHQD